MYASNKTSDLIEYEEHYCISKTISIALWDITYMGL